MKPATENNTLLLGQHSFKHSDPPLYWLSWQEAIASGRGKQKNFCSFFNDNNTSHCYGALFSP